MSDPIISVEDLGKRYTLGRVGTARYQRFSEALARTASRLFKPRQTSQSQDFWALRHVSFNVQQGEVLGIIGRNGAGKSTLLKILSRITAPSEGRIRLRGRIASLLEVGTGFHPELTGRENIYLNGAIMGMSRTEINARFDEIVAFAEVDQFLDTPVKRYSSGMYVRLAFAVAAHLEPEILIVDEVLAVGDALFQQKCLGKLRDVTQRDGRTVLFVSHNLSAIRQLATQCAVLKQGQVEHLGSTDDAITCYLQSAEDSHDVEHQIRQHDCLGGARFVELRFADGHALFQSGQPIRFTGCINTERPLNGARISLSILTQEAVPVASGFSPAELTFASPGRHAFSAAIPALPLAPGRYHCTVALGLNVGSSPVNLDAVTEVLAFEIMDATSDGCTPSQWQPAWGSLKLAPLAVQTV